MNDNNKPLWSGWVKKLIYISIGLIAFSFIAPILITQLRSCIEFNADTGVIGDTIGGIINPFIALAGVIVTGLAFYMQLKANEIQISNFKTELENQKNTFEKQLAIQKEESQYNQFESQFYKMLRLHKENVNEIEITLYEFNESRVYNTSIFDKFSELDRIELTNIPETSEYIRSKKTIKGRDTFVYFSNELSFAYQSYKETILDNDENFNFSLPYKAFFNGIESLIDKSDYKSYLFEEKKIFESSYIEHVNIFNTYKNIKIKAYYPLFEGHENKLGHYYRHLYHTVKFVALESEFLTYPEKRKYLRILRAQLSNYEQAMLFYNYLAYAPEWEKGNKFLSDYRMIHNLYEETLIQDEFFLKRYNELKDLQSSVKTYKENDFIFDSQRWDFE